ncbi:MAG: BON domain-containing protein [Betaproteobacteria bacterium]
MKNDTQLQTDVMAELKWRPGFDAAHIGVAAKDGVITLSGQVTHYAEKAAAEDSAKGVYGVKGIANDIEVDLPGVGTPTDQDIVEAALSAMKWATDVPADKVKVVVKKGWVTLEGTLDSQYQKDAAGRCVRYLMGVASVSNHIVIKPSVNWTDVKTKIEDAFRRHADLEARRITVFTHEGEVTLSGNVSSYSESAQAVAAAWGAPGVTSVSNNLVIAL